MFSVPIGSVNLVKVGGCKAETVLARVGGCEGEFAVGAATLGNDAMLVVEHFVDADEDALRMV